jgi:hypothetical protein
VIATDIAMKPFVILLTVGAIVVPLAGGGWRSDYPAEHCEEV